MRQGGGGDGVGGLGPSWDWHHCHAPDPVSPPPKKKILTWLCSDFSWQAGVDPLLWLCFPWCKGTNASFKENSSPLNAWAGYSSAAQALQPRRCLGLGCP